MVSALVGVGFYADPGTLKDPEISSEHGFSAVMPGKL